MGMERVLSIQNRLQKLLEDAEREAESKINEAQMKADLVISSAKTDASRRLAQAKRGSGIAELLKEEEEKAKKEAESIMKEYSEKAEALREVSEDKVDEATIFVLKEVLPS